jgi:hypothetical protein
MRLGHAQLLRRSLGFLLRLNACVRHKLRREPILKQWFETVV